MRTWRVRDVMTTDVVTVGTDTPYRQIVDVLTGRRISAVPVVDAEGRVCGVVSEADLLHKIEAIGQPRRRVFVGRRHRQAQSKAGAVCAADLMTAPAVTVDADVVLAQAARIMDHRHVKRLVVVDDAGRPAGIVTRTDLLTVYLRSDADIRQDVAQEVLRKVLMIDEGTVRVEVTDGVVRLSGTLDRRTSADIAIRLAAQVIGAVGVIDELGYEFDDTVLAGFGPYAAPLG